MKIDPYRHKERYLAWKERSKEGVEDVSKKNSDIILRYITNMEHGINVSVKSSKGARSYIRINTLREKMVYFAKKFKELYNLDEITEIDEEKLVLFFAQMRNGEIKRRDGKTYVGVGDYVKSFKAFWHWYQKISKKEGKDILDITTDLDSKNPKPRWVYLDEKQVRKLSEAVKPDYRALILFLFDSGIRSPTELINVKVSDFFNDFREVNIRDEISKTFGRRIKLMICPQILKEYVENKGLSENDYIFGIKPATVNKYLKRVAQKVFGDAESPAGQKYSDLTLYDFRHISCCYWMPRYKSESALKYRFGWKKSDKIHYYSELLGMKDTIAEEDMLVDVTKTEIEKRLSSTEHENTLLRDQIAHMQEQMQQILSAVNGVQLRIK